MENSKSIEGEGFVPTLESRQPTGVKEAMTSSPLRAAIYLWAGGFWIWLLAGCLSDQYPAFKALLLVPVIH